MKFHHIIHPVAQTFEYCTSSVNAIPGFVLVFKYYVLGILRQLFSQASCNHLHGGNLHPFSRGHLCRSSDHANWLKCTCCLSGGIWLGRAWNETLTGEVEK